MAKGVYKGELFHSSTSFVMENKRAVLIVGSSFIRRLQAFIYSQRRDENLLPAFEVSWVGRGGMRWDAVLPLLRQRRALSTIQPDVIIIHAGGNSIGVPGLDSRRLLRQIKEDLADVIDLFPGSIIFFSDILPCRNWRYQLGRGADAMNRTRRWLHLSAEGNLELYRDFRQALWNL